MPPVKIIHTRDYDLFCQGQLADPYPVLRELRNTEPVHWCEPWGCWIVTSYDDVQQGHLHSRLSSDKARITMNALPGELRIRVDGLGKHLALWVSHTDPPGHKRLRESVQQPFMARNVAVMQTRIAGIAHDLIDAVAPRGRLDVICDLASPLTVTVICEVLGIPPQDRDQFQAWVEEIVAFTDAPASRRPDTAEQALSGLTDLSEYFAEIIRRKCAEPEKDLISALLCRESGRDVLHPDEVLAMCVQMLVGAYDTTAALIGNSVLLLLRHPEMAELLRTRPERIETAIEEFLRYESPAPRNSRIAMADIELGGQQIREGQIVALMLSAANRDPKQFSDPDRLDIGRSPNRHLAFGSGAHFCLGAPLARLEGQIAITTILQKMPGLRPVEQSALERPLWHPSTGLRMLKTLPVMFDV